MFEIVNGSKEQVVVDLKDLTGAVTNLSTASPKFSVKKSDGTTVVNLATASAVNMRVYCLIDTVAVTYTVGSYRLFVSFTSGSEVPLILAGDFQII